VDAPDYSLGHYDDSGKFERPSGGAGAEAPGYYTSHFFAGGQRCDETGKGRATEVQYFCCPFARSAGE
jgi:hypothetical protein